MKTVLSKLFLLCLLVGCATSQQLPQPRFSNSAGSVPSVSQFMSDALYNGLKRDNFPKSQLGVFSQDLFVGKCPICGPTEQGISSYRREEGAGSGVSAVPEEIMAGLKSDSREDKMKAFSALVARYTAWQHTALKLTKEQDAKLKEALHAARKQGMERKSRSFGAFCPSCDGACEIKKE